MNILRLAAALLLALCLGANAAAAAQPTTPAAAGPPQQVDGPTISVLVRTTIIALHQANVTGNYSVLRDLGAVELQQANSDADLAARFATFRQNQISLAAAVLLDAVLDQKPQLTTNGQLRLVGHFPTRPQEIIFDITYLYEGGIWRIGQLNVGTRPAQTGQAVVAAPASPQKPAAKPAKPKQ